MDLITVILFSIPDFIGAFHPLLVHLPVGVLLLAALFQLLARKEKFKSLSPAVSIALLIGMLSAVASCISGYFLSGSGDYDEALLFKHQWFGIALALIAVSAYFSDRYNVQNKVLPWLMIILIFITGHFGGSITHGSGYLTKAFSSAEHEVQKRKPIPDVQQAQAYKDIIKPIFMTKCYKCHGPEKQKGKLRLDIPDLILKGGKGGQVIVAGNTDESELIKRILLSKDNEDHMPPIEQPQLTKDEMELIHWWISSGADFNKKVNALVQTDKIKPVLMALQSEEVKDEVKLSDIPEEEIKAADNKVIVELLNRGVALTTVSKSSNYLSANFVAVDSITAQDFNLLEQLKDHLIWLKLGDSDIKDKDLETVAKLRKLSRLSLERTAISDKGIAVLKGLNNLHYLNLIGTKVSYKGLQQLKALNQLNQLYLYSSAVSTKDFPGLKKLFPQAVIDTGGYKLQFLESDTVELKTARAKE